MAARPTPTMASAGRAARSRSSSPATSATAASSSSPSARLCANSSKDFGGGTRTGRPIRAVQVGGPLGAYLPESLLDTPLDYESMAAAKRHARPWRDRRLRRQRRHGAPGALRLRVLRQGKLRQVHALPDRLDARRRDGRQDHRRPGPPKERPTVARSLRGDDRRLALRARRADAACRSSARSIISARISPRRRARVAAE